MKSKSLWIVNGLALLGCVYLFLALFERYSTERDGGWGPEAIRNPYLAAQQYLQRQGIPAHSLYSLNDTVSLEEMDTLFIEEGRALLTSQQAERLLAWVEAGGNLVVGAGGNLYEEADPLLLMLDVTTEETGCGCAEKHAAEDELAADGEGGAPEGQTQEGDSLTDAVMHHDVSDQVTAEQNRDATTADNSSAGGVTHGHKDHRPLGDWLLRRESGSEEGSGLPKEDDLSPDEDVDPDHLTTLYFDDADAGLRIHFSPGRGLRHPYLDGTAENEYEGMVPLYWAGSHKGVHFMQFELGRGLITVTSDAYLWHSDEIGAFDNAYLLSILAGDRGSVWFLSGNRMPTLFTLAWRSASELIIAFCVWLTLWLIYRGRRFLPPVPATVSARRSLSEHINAVARFHWQRHDSGTLVASIRAEIDRRAAMTLRHYASSNESERARILAAHSGVDLQHVLFALSARDVRQAEQFTLMIQSLQKIRSTL
ncbi:DUF4350 domain-containing protein [Pseudomaricurvus sp. HS19]|uniref:DUF4350 domain-containing protein n=1 Tax=Pseudomaricurvus sp. HS19 TaxID=2692626 RepID=UPI001368F3BF|nr:DUF4350 domain-containing protein [Pseudomaricurvus sp. HS19]MYM62945.1 DUF4350 domain-containing protein [Pseudomaricurvus sp. HS19]